MSSALWVAGALILVFLEIWSTTTFFIPFAVAALLTSLLAVFSTNFSFQLLTFSILSICSLAFLRPTLKKLLSSKSEDTATGTAKMLDKTALALTIVDSKSGLVIVDGDKWSARCNQGLIQVGENCRIVAIDGAIAQVDRIVKD